MVAQMESETEKKNSVMCGSNIRHLMMPVNVHYIVYKMVFNVIQLGQPMPERADQSQIL